jgi:hypothetical protein
MTLPAAVANNNKNRTFSNPIELPSLEEIEAMEKQRQNAIDSLEIIDNNSKTKCQRRSQAIPIFGRLPRPKAVTRIDILQKRLSYFKSQPRSGSIDSINKALALYSSESTDYKFFCSPCWDQAYLIYEQERNKEKERI